MHFHIPPVACAVEIRPAETIAWVIFDQYGVGVWGEPLPRMINPRGIAWQWIVRKQMDVQTMNPTLRQMHGVESGQHRSKGLDFHPRQIEWLRGMFRERHIQRQHIRPRARPCNTIRVQVRFQGVDQMLDLDIQRVTQRRIADRIVVG